LDNCFALRETTLICVNVTGLTSILCINFLSYCVQKAKAIQNWPIFIFRFDKDGVERS